MRQGLKVGDIGRLATTVDASQTITLGETSPVIVFSTPAMINLMEHAAREALRPYLEAGEESVGIEVNVRHTAATPLGAEVHAEARVTAIEGKVVRFDIAALDAKGQIGHGTHSRAVVLQSQLGSKLAERHPGMAESIALNTEKLPEFQTLAVAIGGAIANVTLNRPEKRNAINQRMTTELEQLVGWLAGHAEEVRVVIIDGAGRAFSAGDDVTDLAAGDVEAVRMLSERRGRLYDRFTRLPQVLIAAINGPALGGGCVCACSCDLRLASYNATVGLPEIAFGWPPTYGLASVVAAVGKARALELSLTGRVLSAREAHSWGFVQELVAAAQLLPRARELAKMLLELSPVALGEAKQLFAGEVVGTASDRRASDAFARCLATDDAKKRIQAFRERRSGRFNR